MASSDQRLFTPYQVLIIVVLSLLQFIIILDFMVLSHCWATLLPRMYTNFFSSLIAIRVLLAATFQISKNKLPYTKLKSIFQALPLL